MIWLVLGLLVFLLPHSVRALAPARREAWIAQWGLNGWKLRYTVVSLIGLALVIWGYGQARTSGIFIWVPPMGLKHANSLFTLVAMLLLAASIVPKNHITAAVRHPLTLTVKVWAFGHLLAVGSLAGVVLFGSFLVWSILVFKSARQRDQATGANPPAGRWPNTLITMALGLGLWALVAFWAHKALIGVRLFG
jgi:uncharacterized membrane protein